MKYKYVSNLVVMPINCPVCQGALLNEFKELPYGKPYAIAKTCYKQDHRFYCCSSKGNEDEVNFISLSLDVYKKNTVNWLVKDKKMYIYKTSNVKITGDEDALTYIPYVDPDFSDAKKLLNKINLYLKFL
jgi:hypothetical protein